MFPQRKNKGKCGSWITVSVNPRAELARGPQRRSGGGGERPGPADRGQADRGHVGGPQGARRHPALHRRDRRPHRQAVRTPATVRMRYFIDV